MSLRVWLPLNGDLLNKGLSDIQATVIGSNTWPAGKIGSKSFQGGTGTQVTNGIQLNNNMTDLLSGEYSIAIWVKPMGTHVHYNGAIFSSGNWNYKAYNFGISQDNSKVDVLCNRYNIYINCSVPVNEWTHLCCTRKGNLISLYKNGIYVDSLIREDNPESDNDNISTIGRLTYGNGYFSFNGCLNDFRLYDHCLSLKEIKEISKGLILHYPLDNDYDNIVYDCSGYLNNGIIDNITYSTDTPKYSFSSLFTSSNNSYIKVNNNNWMAQHAKEMTINFWAYADNWSNQVKLFSCTQSGGFNTEQGDSGYIRFPIYVCTNLEQTSYAYKYDSKLIKNSDLSSGWHMFTFIYEAATGTKTYIDGQLHHIYNNVSYGIRFNTNARLFLGCLANAANPTSPYFNGKQSDFRIYYTVLSENDIKELYSVRASCDRDSNFYSSGKFIEQGYSNLIEHLYDIENAGSYTGIIIKDENGINLSNNIWVNHDFIPIDPTNKIYKYDITFSNTSGNRLYIGWERYDANKTSRSNNSCVYVQSNSTEREYYRIRGTIDLSTDGVNPCAFIRIRILNKWTGSTADTEGKAIIHSLSLKEFSSSDNFDKIKISHEGNTYTTELQLKNEIPIYITRTQELNANSFIEN